MLSAVLKSQVAVDVSIEIIRAFVDMRKFIVSNSRKSIVVIDNFIDQVTASCCYLCFQTTCGNVFKW
jgi:hypothetical protein